MYHLLVLALVVGQASSPAAGHLIIVGGGPMDPAIPRRALAIAGGKQAHVLVIPQASLLADSGARSEAMWREAGATHVAVLDLTDHKAALAKIRQADLIWLPGGDQCLLMSALKGHGLIAAIQQRFHDGATVGGTSAGAAVMSMAMLTAESKIDRVTGDTTRMAQGLGLWP
ncbi:MAG TPA: Type 1 glutamine amidotransferase-like domain-containing protein, partial [Gemmataceae bacterium]|nr:Type 1 glutamine amidotransferase-like domain-containing protein [Gemmataceae bacterium]